MIFVMCCPYFTFYCLIIRSKRKKKQIQNVTFTGASVQQLGSYYLEIVGKFSPLTANWVPCMRTLETHSAHVCCYISHHHMSYSLKHTRTPALTDLSEQFIGSLSNCGKSRENDRFINKMNYKVANDVCI